MRTSTSSDIAGALSERSVHLVRDGHLDRLGHYLLLTTTHLLGLGHSRAAEAALACDATARR